jgi:hypothetical protein
MRVSLYFYNSREDVDAFIDKLRGVLAMFQSMGQGGGDGGGDAAAAAVAALAESGH